MLIWKMSAPYQREAFFDSLHTRTGAWAWKKRGRFSDFNIGYFPINEERPARPPSMESIFTHETCSYFTPHQCTGSEKATDNNRFVTQPINRRTIKAPMPANPMNPITAGSGMASMVPLMTRSSPSRLRIPADAVPLLFQP